MTIQIDKGKCIGCGACVTECPTEALELVDGIIAVNPDKCTDCGSCIEACPTNTLSLPGKKQDTQAQPSEKATDSESKTESGVNASPSKAIQSSDAKTSTAVTTAKAADEWSGVWVVIEYNRGEVAPVSWELLGVGRKLADDLGCELAGVLIGKDVDPVIPEAFAYGAEKLYVIDDPILEPFRTQPYAEGLTKLVNKYKPEILLMGATAMGRDVFPVVATKLQTGLTADCTVLEIDPQYRLLLQTRPAFGGNIMATILCKTRRPQMATVRPRVMPMPPKIPGRTGEIIREELGISENEILTKVLEYVKGDARTIFLDKAEIIVAAGLGVGAKRNMALIEELADVLGASIAGSRGVVEAGWLPHEQQVGQTGITVRPKLYIAVGISGAIQHLVGMETSDCIVAINNDPDAPIFRVATYGIVGDLFQVVPALTYEFKKRLQHGVAK